MKNKKLRRLLSLILACTLTCALPIQASAYSINDTLTFNRSSYTDISSNFAWSLSGNPILISNNPETSYGEGFLYEDSTINSTGAFRVYWAHRYAITGSDGGYVGFFLFNNTGKTIKVNLGKYGYAVDSVSTTAGATAYQRWLQRSSSETTYATVQDGSYTYISFYTDNGSVCIGQYDIIIRDTSNNLVTGGITVKTFLSYSAPSTFLTRNRDLLATVSNQSRGKITYNTKTLNWTNATQGTALAFTSTVYNSWGVPANDLDTYTSAVDSTTGSHYGGYGMDLNINVTFSQNNSALALVPCVLGTDQSGSLGGGLTAHPMVAKVNGTYMTNNVANGQMWVIATGNAGTTVSVQTSLIGFDYAPMRLVVIPNT